MGNRKSALSARVKGMVEWQLEHYREDLRTIETLKNDLIPSPVQRISGERTGSGTPSRSTENVAERIISHPYVKYLEQSVSAITYVLSRCDETDITIIDLHYWQRALTIEGAAMQAHVSASTAYRRVNAILTAIAIELGYINAEDSM